jgi:tetratricopeptide (TPR) repeat protein
MRYPACWGECSIRFVIGLALSLTWLWPTRIGDAAEPGNAIVKPSSEPFCLTTEFLPIPYQEGVYRLPLVRELGRQAVLIAARDGLGISTRDQTLEEPFPESPNSGRGPFALEIRANYAGNCSLKFGPSSVAGVLTSDATSSWAREVRYTADSYNVYTSLATALAEASRSVLVDALKEAGFTGQGLQADPSGQIPADIETLLEEMNFVPQFAALRRIHAAIVEKGESPARLGGLVRGYANLAVLTRHYWNSCDSAFAARSLLYAERMITVDGNSRLAIQHRAYARALIGLHGMALQDLAKLPAKDGAATAEETATEPTWAKVIEPYCRFDSEKLLTLAAEPSLKQLANQLAFEVKASYGDDRWNTEAGKLAVAACPNSYGVYAVLAHESPMLIERQVIQIAADTFGRQLPQQVTEMSGFPQSIAALLGDQKKQLDDNAANSSQENAKSIAISPRPIRIAQALRGYAATAGDRNEPSWNVLATLIAEEQFIQAESILDVSRDAVEHSEKELVGQLEPLVQGHRYAPYVRLFAANTFPDPTLLTQYAGEIDAADPRGRMKPMFVEFGGAVDKNGKSFTDLAADALWQHEYHSPGLIEACQLVYDSWWQAPNTVKAFQRLIVDLHAISPFAPTGIRIEVDTTEDPTAEQLGDWEARGKADPYVLSHVAQIYARRKQYEPAIRCYEHAYELSPNCLVTIPLANSYRDNGQEDKWLPTMERYFKEEDYSLGHSVIHCAIADDYIAKGKWTDAEPHALESAQTWSCMGLMTASRVYEGLGQWDKSEYWIREASQNYPTYEGIQWYLWCRRTGRGNVLTAKQLADTFLQQPWVNADGHGDYLFVNDMLDKRYDDALARLINKPGIEDDPCWQTHILLLTRRLKKTDFYDGAKYKLQKLMESKFRDSDPDFYSVITAMFGGEGIVKLNDKELTKLCENVAKFPASARCNYQYLLGELLSLEGDSKHAEQLWSEAVAGGPFDNYTATLAGERLAEKHHVSRSDTPSAKAAKKSDDSKVKAPQSDPQAPPPSETR